ncbi:MAG: Ig-like domain-containing protein [Candidatus Eremiobacteraeota bacterium]|nr:Ig-like domain-containing protein [Candidatus Eremiobacteraeota bacterium]
MMYEYRIFTLACAIGATIVLASCAEQKNYPLKLGVACTPAPVPRPNVTLVAPISGATNVPRALASIRVKTYGAVNSVTLNGTGTPVTFAPAAAVGTPDATGQQTFEVSVAAQLAPNTTYMVAADVVFAPGNCPQFFNGDPAGSFTTAP